jgi:hypothetical protein
MNDSGWYRYIGKAGSLGFVYGKIYRLLITYDRYILVGLGEPTIPYTMKGFLENWEPVDERP